ncbi:30S ribosomal protein S20 [Candidatus Saccharibacteria bacterium RIFCSPLOWO2_01_FULL_49_22]|nr:MAG: 30S ribosomal protein S20 [Candidatus Saccharibacteria bacterium RIFCSPLOWO2_01_FULL_49_22]
MPIIKSAKKRVKLAAKAHARNARTKRTLREALKAYQAALAQGKPAEITKTQKAAIRALDMAAKKSVIHKNKAARKKSQLVAQAKSAGVKPSKTTVKKPVAKKPAIKRATASKPARSRTSVHK